MAACAVAAAVSGGWCVRTGSEKDEFCGAGVGRGKGLMFDGGSRRCPAAAMGLSVKVGFPDLDEMRLAVRTSS